jgi:glycosyltransferase involved in cell wall biosynthesis
MENKVSVILPIKSGKYGMFDEYFLRCVQSVKNQSDYVEELIIVHTDETILDKFLNGFDFSGLTVNRILWTEEPNFAKQVNKGVSDAKSEWVSLLEFDDEYSNIWFKNVDKYIKHYPEVESFLPIVVDVDDKGVFAGFTNEATFAANFTSELGVLSNEMLQT